MEYTEKDLYEGMKLRCTDKVDVSWWTTGKEYEVIKSVDKKEIDKNGPYYILDDSGDKRDTSATILRGLNDRKAPVAFDVVKEKDTTEYVEVTKLLHWSADFQIIALGKKYKVAAKDKLNNGVYIYVNDAISHYFLRCDQFKYACKPEQKNKLEEIKMEYTKKDLYEGMKLKCVYNRQCPFWEEGKVYTLTKDENGDLVIAGERTEEYTRTKRHSDYILACLNDDSKSTMNLVHVIDTEKVEKEKKEDEEEMEAGTEYVKVIKFISWSRDHSILEKGKKYKVVEKDTIDGGVCIYVSEKEPHYYLTPAQYTKIKIAGEKPGEEKNDAKMVKQAIQDKIDALTYSAEKLFAKRDRLNDQAINLNAKARRLEEVIDVMEEFE